eukprot:CAMPEP_0119334628 /NCGR_PEP_ID=MMETSP1333-20130426/87699_1 /TAXON_ID=418940 /ORGANISM="Scyphosphaera apsteinii, Strain RCC1455" /LENGTH=82 /DNA_ID=CAMNT_0007344969 /DNA_START=24 /DNA_END=268 /DNA_ORIENTATION=+
MGDSAGLIGVWMFEKVISARDGGEMLSAEEIAPLRAARYKEMEQQAKLVEAEHEKKRQREAERRAREAAIEAEEPAPPPKER